MSKADRTSSSSSSFSTPSSFSTSPSSSAVSSSSVGLTSSDSSSSLTTDGSTFTSKPSLCNDSTTTSSSSPPSSTSSTTTWSFSSKPSIASISLTKTLSVALLALTAASLAAFSATANPNVASRLAPSNSVRTRCNSFSAADNALSAASNASATDVLARDMASIATWASASICADVSNCDALLLFDFPDDGAIRFLLRTSDAAARTSSAANSAAFNAASANTPAIGDPPKVTTSRTRAESGNDEALPSQRFLTFLEAFVTDWRTRAPTVLRGSNQLSRSDDASGDVSLSLTSSSEVADLSVRLFLLPFSK
mmetsp:Transcript_3097/g.6816  ORF Transcript_3097/g.6816 Transcript_3097/m.6816 type:complete len:310 (-) Transcript_3097:342-1271(-)